MNRIRQQQADREKAEFEANEEAKRIQRENEEEQEKREKALRLEQERRQRLKQKEHDRIQRQREAGLYQTKEQRKKHQQAQVQLGAAGIEVPMRHNARQLTTDENEPVKRRILYDDRRKANRTGMSPNISLS